MTTITIDRVVVEHALEALELSMKLLPDVLGGKRSNAAIALRAALAEPAQEPVQEPVAWVDERIHGWPDCFVMEADPPYTTPLYLAPPQRKPLSEDEALDIARTFGAQPWPPGSCVAFARAVEKAHGIGGGA